MLLVTDAAANCSGVCLQRPPVLGILTRHDFMPQYIRGLFQNVLRE